MDPLTGISTALTRRDLAGGESFAPGPRMGLQVAIAAGQVCHRAL